MVWPTLGSRTAKEQNRTELENLRYSLRDVSKARGVKAKAKATDPRPRPSPRMRK